MADAEPQEMLARLAEHLGSEHLGFDIVRRELGTGELSATLTGGFLDTEIAQLRAAPDLCHFTLVAGILESVPEVQRLPLVIDLLKLNSEHVFGRVSLARVRGAVVQRSEEWVLAVVCETMFFWAHDFADREWLREKFNRRVTALVRLARDVRRKLEEAGQQD